MQNKGLTYFILFFVLVLSTGDSFAQKGNIYLRKGNKAYEDKNYKEAEDDYQKALGDQSAAVKGKFNLGDAYFRQGQYDKAVDAYKQALSLTKDKVLTSHAYHNIGNSLMEQKKYDESVKSYENSLTNNPKDDDTRYNLAYAQSKLQQQQQKQKQDQQKQKQDVLNKKQVREKMLANAAEVMYLNGEYQVLVQVAEGQQQIQAENNCS